MTNRVEDPIRVGEIVVFRIEGREIPIVHRVLKIHEKYESMNATLSVVPSYMRMPIILKSYLPMFRKACVLLHSYYESLFRHRYIEKEDLMYIEL